MLLHTPHRTTLVVISARVVFKALNILAQNTSSQKGTRKKLLLVIVINFLPDNFTFEDAFCCVVCYFGYQHITYKTNIVKYVEEMFKIILFGSVR